MMNRFLTKRTFGKNLIQATGANAENRFSERSVTNTDVSLYKYGIYVAQGTIKNRSKYGFFIESTFPDIRPFQVVDIRLLLKEPPHKPVCYKFNSLVIYTNENGFGVEFDSAEDEYDEAALSNII